MLYRAIISIWMNLRAPTDDVIPAFQSSIGGIQFLAFASAQTDLDHGASIVCKFINYAGNEEFEINSRDVKIVLASVQKYLVGNGTIVRTLFPRGFVKFRYQHGGVAVEGNGKLNKFYIKESRCKINTDGL